MINSKRNILYLLIIILTCSCINRFEDHGYSFELTQYQPKTGISSRSEIIRNMGSPTLMTYINDEITWIYFEEKTKRMLFFKPTIIKRKILTLSFDQDNIAKNVKYYDLEDENNFDFSYKHTKVREIKKNWFVEIFSNIGQVTPQ